MTTKDAIPFDLAFPAIDDPIAIFEFAMTFDGYREYGSFEASAAAARNTKRASLNELRNELFFAARASRHSEDMEYVACYRELMPLMKRLNQAASGGIDAALPDPTTSMQIPALSENREDALNNVSFVEVVRAICIDDVVNAHERALVGRSVSNSAFQSMEMLSKLWQSSDASEQELLLQFIRLGAAGATASLLSILDNTSPALNTRLTLQADCMGCEPVTLNKDLVDIFAEFEDEQSIEKPDQPGERQ